MSEIFELCPDCCPECPSPQIFTSLRSNTFRQGVFWPLNLVPLYPWGTNTVGQAQFGYTSSLSNFTYDYTAEAEYYGNSWYCGCVKYYHSDFANMAQTYTDTFSGSIYSRSMAVSDEQIVVQEGFTSCVDSGIEEPFSTGFTASIASYRYAISESNPTATPSYRGGSFSSGSTAYNGYTDCTLTVFEYFPSSYTKAGNQTLSGQVYPSTIVQNNAVVLSSLNSSSYSQASPQSYNVMTSASVSGFRFNDGDTGYYDLTARLDQYYFRFNPTNLKKYKVSYFERTIHSSGSAILGYEILNKGQVYYVEVIDVDDVYHEYPAEIITEFNSVGQIIRANVLYGGENYLNPPQINIYGGYTTASITALISDGVVTTASVTVAGNYLPVYNFNKPSGGTAATASVTLDSWGGINSFNFTNYGLGYTADPTPTVSGSFSFPYAPSFYFNLGQEVYKEFNWNNVLPVSFSVASQSTWPTLPFYSVESASVSFQLLPLPLDVGTNKLANIKYEC